MPFDLPPTHHFKIEAAATSHCRLEANARQHTVVIDEPAVRGGSDSAATPLETMLASFLACLNVISHLIADEMGIEIKDLSMSLDATFDTDGIRNTTPTTLPFPEIALTMNHHHIGLRRRDRAAARRPRKALPGDGRPYPGWHEDQRDLERDEALTTAARDDALTLTHRLHPFFPTLRRRALVPLAWLHA